MPHVWHLWTPFVPEAKQALERAAQFVRRHAREGVIQVEPIADVGATAR